jgi:hypothetical protein
MKQSFVCLLHSVETTKNRLTTCAASLRLLTVKLVQTSYTGTGDYNDCISIHTCEYCECFDPRVF